MNNIELIEPCIALVSFKVSLLNERNRKKEEIRRFDLPKSCSTSFVSLTKKLRSIFENLESRFEVKIFWKDEDGDDILIKTDAELKGGDRFKDLNQFNGYRETTNGQS